MRGRCGGVVPPQNPVDRTIVDVSVLGVKLGYPMLDLLYVLLATARSGLKLQRESADGGKVIALPMVGGLHHRYTRRAA